MTLLNYKLIVEPSPHSACIVCTVKDLSGNTVGVPYEAQTLEAVNRWLRLFTGDYEYNIDEAA
jgi:hypothetical protein